MLALLVSLGERAVIVEDVVEDDRGGNGTNKGSHDVDPEPVAAAGNRHRAPSCRCKVITKGGEY